jgi:hypothetical protein
MRRDLILVIIIGRRLHWHWPTAALADGCRNSHRQDHYGDNSCSTRDAINRRY